jgi:signal transduction histidine kinase
MADAIIGIVSLADRFFHSASVRLERAPKDVLLAIAAAAVQLSVIFMAHSQPDREGIDALAVTLLLAGPAALLLRRRAPVTVLGVTTLVTLAYWTLDYPRGPVIAAVAVAFVGAVLDGHRAAAWAKLALAAVAFPLLPALVGDEPVPTLAKGFGIVVWLFLVAAGAEIIRAKREHHSEIERTRRQETLARAGQERLRIARELHDVLAHNVSLINVQAGVALHLLDGQPDRARPALEAIKDASSQTLGEMRSVLSILRRPGEAPPRFPTAGIGGLRELVARTTAAGIPVETEFSGEPRPLPASVDLAVYRIVQEALTNVARHARPAGAVVRLSYGEDDVTVEVDDAGVNGYQPNGRPGNGIAGMRERVAALGGDFAAGRRPDAGFRVSARLPLDANR